jgi:hypothetical protein
MSLLGYRVIVIKTKDKFKAQKRLYRLTEFFSQNLCPLIDCYCRVLKEFKSRKPVKIPQLLEDVEIDEQEDAS